MNHHRTLFLLPALAAALAAQQSTLVVSPTLSPRSVEAAGSDHVILSFTQDGQQQTVNVVSSNGPFVQGGLFDATYFDQLSDAAYTHAFGGRLLTAHRFGGITMIDASNPPALATLYAQIQPPKYSHEGLRVFESSALGPVVLYGEHNVSNSGGGLRAYAMSPTALFELDNDLMVGRDGLDLAFNQDASYVWQLGSLNNNPADHRLLVWQTNSFTNLQMVNTVAIPSSTAVADAQIAVNERGYDNLVGALGFGGLRAFDVGNPAAPLPPFTIWQNPSWYFDGVTFFPGTDFGVVWGYVQVGNTFIDFILVIDATVPGLVTLIPPYVLFPGIRVADVELVTPSTRFAYVWGTDRNTGEARLQVW